MGNLTNAQKSIWVTEQYYKGSSINNICGTAVIQEKVDFEKLKESIQIVCKKHDNFWLEFKLNEGNVEQVLSEKKEIQIDTINIAGENQLELERNKIVKTRFQLENSKLFKFYIFKFIDGKGAFMLNIHHLISDAWTLALICNDIIKTYSELIQNKEVEKKAIYSYIDYIKSEQQYQESEKYNKDKQYWIERFKTIPEVATIPGSIKGDIDETNPAGEREKYEISKENVEKIKKYCKENKISLYNFFMAIYAIYIGEVSNLDEFTIGTPILNRTNYKEKNAAGMFINMAPFRININEDIEFKQFIKNIARDSMDMLKHQKYSYQCLLEELRKENKSIPNLYNILLSYQITNAKQNEGNIEYETEWTFNGYCADNIDIQIYDLNDTGNLNIAYDYKTSIYKVEDIENIHRRILNIIKQVVSKEEIKLSEIDIVTPEEKEKLLVEFNKTELKYDENIPFIKYFEKQVEKTPDDIAIVFEDKEMTYRELNERANSLAYKLRENEVTNNTVVGILLERSFEMLISMLAVLKSGGCYIPIAPDYPKDRIEYMLEDSEATIILTSQNRRNLADKKLINVKDERIYENHKENLENISKPEDLSYLIYTSGSTGTPKGVMLKQKNLSNFYNSMKNIIEYLKDGKNHKILSITTVSFDIFGFETLMSLTRGLTVYLTSENGQKMTSKIERIVKDSNVEIMQTTPSVMKFHLENLNDENSLKSLKYIMLAGEPLTKTLVDRIKQIIPNVTIYNGYGPSETTIFSTIGNATNQEEITIGRPINNTQIYILNKNKKVMPQGTIGELYISGDGVGKGYMNKEQQTNESFIINPFIDGKVMYKVGDLGAFDDKGEITCYGRIDNQVKIRGLRIELQEIEKRMQSVYNIHDCVVVKKVVKEKDALCAYYVERGHVSKTVLKTVLYSKLPEYMVPQYFVKMEQLPHTPNGKVDRKALPDPVIDEEKIEITKPRNEAEELLINIIRKKLGVNDFGIDTNIFDVGADSLTVISIATELFRYNYNIKVSDIYKYQTVRELYDNVFRFNERSIQQLEHPELIKINEKVSGFSKDVQCKKIKERYNILLTGATGFFGSHLLIELLQNTEYIDKIYCIVRPKAETSVKKRLYDKIKFYFNNKYDEFLDKYVQIVEGKITEEKLGLKENEYEKLLSKIDIVIHSAANVSHYGNYKNSEEANIIATRNIINFCQISKAKLHYISTMTISGNYLEKQEQIENRVFDENSFYIGQNFEENVYSKSKLIAEALVIKYMSDTCKATIYRLGDLTGRYSDGGFQENINSNATYMRLKSILEIGAIPNELENINLEFSPVDQVAKAVKLIIWSDKCENRIFNIYNPNNLVVSDLLDMLEKKNYYIKLMKKDEFTRLIKEISENTQNQNKVNGIINDFVSDDELIYKYIIKPNNEITCKYLKKLGFTWEKINDIYIYKLIEYMKKVKFIK